MKFGFCVGERVLGEKLSGILNFGLHRPNITPPLLIFLKTLIVQKFFSETFKCGLTKVYNFILYIF
jgi:hypothetical protein